MSLASLKDRFSNFRFFFFLLAAGPHSEQVSNPESRHQRATASFPLSLFSTPWKLLCPNASDKSHTDFWSLQAGGRMRDRETVRREEAWVDNGEDGEHKELGGGGYRKAERPMSLCKSKTCFSRLILQMCTSCVPNPRCRRLWRVTSVMQTCPFSSPDPPLIKKVPP